MDVKNKTFDEERALYALRDSTVEDCMFAGPADGESALKETRRIVVRDSKFELRYPFWHCADFKLIDSEMTPTCRAAVWYSSDGEISGSTLNGAKCFRECDRIKLNDCKAVSSEFAWKCRGFEMYNCEIESEYMLLESRDIIVDKLKNNGKYSFQYTTNVKVTDSEIRTKDAFWHTKNAVVENCVIESEYLAWYSDNLTLRNCEITGSQPFCYCTNLKLENCRLHGCDLAFEYSDVDADIRGEIISVKNPKSGRIVADKIGEIIRGNAVYPCDCKIIERQ